MEKVTVFNVVHTAINLLTGDKNFIRYQHVPYKRTGVKLDRSHVQPNKRQTQKMVRL